MTQKIWAKQGIYVNHASVIPGSSDSWNKTWECTIKHQFWLPLLGPKIPKSFLRIFQLMVSLFFNIMSYTHSLYKELEPHPGILWA